MQYRADFHIHSCLSPCASLEMSPAAIVQRAKDVGLNAIALSDHNCAFNYLVMRILGHGDEEESLSYVSVKLEHVPISLHGSLGPLPIDA